MINPPTEKDGAVAVPLGPLDLTYLLAPRVLTEVRSHTDGVLDLLLALGGSESPSVVLVGAAIYFLTACIASGIPPEAVLAQIEPLYRAGMFTPPRLN